MNPLLGPPSEPVGEPALSDRMVEEWRTGIERIRSTIKWIISVFGATGAVLVGTAPLANLGKAGGNRPVLLLLGIGALLAVGVAILAASRVLLTETVTLTELAQSERLRRFRDAVDLDPTSYLGTWADSVSELRAAWRRQIRTVKGLDRLLEEHADDPDAFARITEARGIVLERGAELSNAVRRLLLVAAYHKVTDRFRTAQWIMYGGAFLAGAAIIAYFTVLKAGG